MKNPFDKFNDFITSNEYKNMDKKERHIKAALLAPSNKEIEAWNEYEILRKKGIDKLVKHGRKQGLTKNQIRRKYVNILLIDNNIEFNKKVFEITQ